MSSPAEFDVLVLGAGPAGNCVALRLLMLGHSVALVESQAFPRPHVGESLSPGVWKLFQYMDAIPLLQNQTYIQGLGAKVIWEDHSMRDLRPEDRGPGVLVNRSKLDKDMLELGQKRGLKVWQPARAEGMEWKGNEWVVQVHQEGERHEVRARFVVDATGSNHPQDSQLMGLAPSMVAIWADLLLDPGFRENRVEARPEGWLWGSPLLGGRTRQMALTDPSALQQQPPAQVLAGMLRKSQLFRSTTLPAYAVQTTPVHIYAHTSPWKDNYVRIGTAVLSLDPLSATGVEKALRQAMQAAIAIHTVLIGGDGDMAQEYFEDRLVEAAVSHTGWGRNYYGIAWPGQEKTFYRDRAAYFSDSSAPSTPFSQLLQENLKSSYESPGPIPLEPVDINQALAELWGKSIGLSPQTLLLETPCVKDDRLVRRTVLSHPGLDRKFAFLGEIEVIPLIEKVSPAATLGELVQAWSKDIPFEMASKVAIWLWQKDILQETS